MNKLTVSSFVFVAAGALFFMTFAPVQADPPPFTGPVDCSLVRCASCPPGQKLSPTPGNCCRCVPDAPPLSRCATVLCAQCPEGTVAAPTPGNCCRCVQDRDRPQQAECSTDADCRLFSNYCDGCNCDALAVDEPDPRCNGTIVNCFADPCADLYPVCNTVSGQCEASSTNPVCALPADVGPCDAIVPRWFFNNATGQCELFDWGGCGGNGNNFETEAQCQRACL